jgi:hypothetical protein
LPLARICAATGHGKKPPHHPAPIKALIPTGHDQYAARFLTPLRTRRPRDAGVLICLTERQSRHLIACQNIVLYIKSLLKPATGLAATQQEAAEACAPVRRFDRAVQHAERAFALTARAAEMSWTGEKAWPAAREPWAKLRG